MDFIASNLFLIISMLAAGFAAGFAGGLFGVGGGVITVPVLYAIFQSVGVDDDVSLKTAIGTSLGVIIITSFRALGAHRKAGHVDMSVLKAWAPWIAVGAGAGGLSARWVPVEALTVIFAAGALYIAWSRMVPNRRAKKQADLMKRQVRGPLGAATGFFSSLLGLGAGAFGVMVMTAAGRPIHQAVATAAGFGVAVALPGVLAFVWSGWAAAGLPQGSLGYFNIVAFLAMAVTAGIAAPLGARLAHRTNGVLLSRLFGVYVLIAAIGLVWDVFGK